MLPEAPRSLLNAQRYLFAASCNIHGHIYMVSKKQGVLMHCVLHQLRHHRQRDFHCYPLFCKRLVYLCLDLQQDTKNNKNARNHEYIEVVRGMYLGRGRCYRDEQPVNKRVSPFLLVDCKGLLECLLFHGWDACVAKDTILCCADGGIRACSQAWDVGGAPALSGVTG